MNIAEKLEKVFSPLDIVTLTKEYEFLASKKSNPDLPENVKADIRRYLACGIRPDRNPSVWMVFKGENVDPSSENWINGMMNLYRLTCKAEISELDNDNSHVRATLEFMLLAVNAKSLPEEAFKEVKCASVRTAFGSFPLEVE